MEKRVFLKEKTLTAMGDVLRHKLGETDKYTVEQMVDKINNIPQKVDIGVVSPMIDVYITQSPNQTITVDAEVLIDNTKLSRAVNSVGVSVLFSPKIVPDQGYISGVIKRKEENQSINGFHALKEIYYSATPAKSYNIVQEEGWTIYELISSNSEGITEIFRIGLAGEKEKVKNITDKKVMIIQKGNFYGMRRPELLSLEVDLSQIDYDNILWQFEKVASKKIISGRHSGSAYNCLTEASNLIYLDTRNEEGATGYFSLQELRDRNLETLIVGESCLNSPFDDIDNYNPLTAPEFIFLPNGNYIMKPVSIDDDFRKNFHVYVPDESLEDFKNHSTWGKMKERIRPWSEIPDYNPASEV